MVVKLFFLDMFFDELYTEIMQQALYWEKEGDKARCRLCPHECLIAEGHAGRCGVRVLRGGILRASGYGMLSGAHNDPIEKKPLYHFHPGSMIFSIGGWGCNLGCKFCQNWGISQQIGRSERTFAPREIVRSALVAAEEQGVARGGIAAIAYTYNEPLINFEFLRECATAARNAGADGDREMKNVLVTNGFVNPAPAAELLPLIDALNIDIKSMEPEFYQDYCAGELIPVLDFVCQARAAGCHLEITNLIVPGLNDRDELFEKLAGWIRENLGGHTPLHLSAYHPCYKTSTPATPSETMERAAELCRRDLHYVYMGNISNGKGCDTCCPGCGELLIERRGYQVRMRGIKDKVCAGCGRALDMTIL